MLGLGATATMLVAVGTLLGARAGDTALGFTIGHAVATVTWMLAATWLLLRGLERSRDADLTLRTGLLLAGISVAKLFLYDLAALNGIVRSVAFIVVGLLLLATGSRYAKAYERRRVTRDAARAGWHSGPMDALIRRWRADCATVAGQATAAGGRRRRRRPAPAVARAAPPLPRRDPPVRGACRRRRAPAPRPSA